MKEQEIQRMIEEVTSNVITYIRDVESQMLSKTLLNSRIQNSIILTGKINGANITYHMANIFFTGSSGQELVLPPNDVRAFVIEISGAGSNASLVIPKPPSGTKVYIIFNDSMTNNVTVKAPGKNGISINSNQTKTIYYSNLSEDYKIVD